VGVVIPYSPEYRRPNGNLALLSHLVEITGGSTLSRPEEVFRRGRGSGQREAWPAVSGIAIALLLTEIAIRRLPAISQRLSAVVATVAYSAGWARRRAGPPQATAEADRKYDAADRWAVEDQQFSEEEKLRAASMEQAARIFIARLRNTRRP